MPDPYEVKAAAGKGLGVFATKLIKPGDIIMHDAAKMKLHRGTNDVSTQQVQDAFSGLSKADRKAFLKLHEGPVEYETRNMKIYKANSFSYAGFSVLYLKFSRVNHACMPNAEMTELDDEKDSKMVALETIGEGEEVLISYVGLLQDGSREDRRRFTKGAYGFVCECHVCCLTGTEGDLSDARRTIYAALASRRAGMEPAKYEWIDNGSAEDGRKGKILGRVERRLKVPLTEREKTAYAFLTAKLLEAEGWQTRQISDAYVHAAMGMLAQINEQKGVVVVEAARLLMAWLEASVGAMRAVRSKSSKDLKELEQFLKDVKQQDIIQTCGPFVSNTAPYSLALLGFLVSLTNTTLVDRKRQNAQDPWLANRCNEDLCYRRQRRWLLSYSR